MNCITQLAMKRLRYHGGRTVLTMTAIGLTACLLMALAAGMLGIIDGEKERLEREGNQHAWLVANDEQLGVLAHHADIAALAVNENVAEVTYGKLDAALRTSWDIRPGINQLQLTVGGSPQAVDEIAGPPAFFERMGVTPEVGAIVTIPFRLQGAGVIREQAFVISGLLAQADLSKLDIEGARLAYAAFVSPAFAEENLQGQPRQYRVAMRLQGAEALSYDAIGAQIYALADALGIAEDDVVLNKGYLAFTTDPSAEMRGTLLAAAALVLFLSAMVIYSIYYVSVTADIKELGRLKALGATRRQMRRLLLTEGTLLTLFGLPAGIALGHLAAYGFLRFSAAMTAQSIYGQGGVAVTVPLSLPMIAAVSLVIAATVYLSLAGPVRKACAVSPIEAITYQEAGSRRLRKGYETMDVNRLCWVNLSRNRKRTAVTMTTMGLSCVLFVVAACVLSSANPEDFARSNIPSGDFRLGLDYRLHDETYPENNLNRLQQQDILSDDMVKAVLDIPGVRRVRPIAKASCAWQAAEGETQYADLRAMTRSECSELAAACMAGTVDYEQMLAEEGIIFTWGERGLEKYGLKVGDAVALTLYDGERPVTVTGKIAAVTQTAECTFLLPQEVFHRLITDVTPTADLEIAVDPAAYEMVKNALHAISADNAHLRLIALDEELQLAKSSLLLVKAPVYGVLILLGVIGFINLINTMISSILSRRRELGILQAIGLSDKELVRMLQKEGLFFTAGALLLAMTAGNLLGFGCFHWAKANSILGITQFHYPFWAMLLMAAVLIVGQMLLAWFISRFIRKDALIERIRQE